MKIKKIFSVSIIVMVMLIFTTPIKVFADASMEKFYEKQGDKQSKVVILVDEPTRYSESVDNGSVGHSSIGIFHENKWTYFGFYAYKDVTGPILFAGVKGNLKTGSIERNHDWTVAKAYYINKDQVFKLMKYAKTYESQKYDLDDNNCTTFVANALRYAGVSNNLNKHYWKSHDLPLLAFYIPIYGYSPAGAGIQLRSTGTYLSRAGWNIPSRPELVFPVMEYNKNKVRPSLY